MTSGGCELSCDELQLKVSNGLSLFLFLSPSLVSCFDGLKEETSKTNNLSPFPFLPPLLTSHLSTDGGHRASVDQRLEGEKVVPHVGETVGIVRLRLVVNEFMLQEDLEADVRPAATKSSNRVNLVTDGQVGWLGR